MRIPAVLVMLVVAVFAAAPARAPLPSEMSAPAWSTGDFWMYRFNTSFGGFIWFNGTVRTDIVGIENRTVRGVAQDVFVADTTGSGTVGASEANGSWALVGEQLISVAGRTIVRNLLRLDAQGTVGPFAVPFVIQWTNRTENLVLYDDWSYPVPVGFSGRLSLNSSFVETVYVRFGANETWTNATLATTVDFDVSLPQTDVVTVPAGTFETFVISESSAAGDSERFDYAPAAGNNARTQTFNASNAEVARTELVSFHYRAAESGNPLVPWVLAIGVGAAVAVAGAWLFIRRRRREAEYTPPSIRDPPT